MYRRVTKMTLMPAVALAVLGATVAIPTLSSSRLYAAAPARYAVVTVRPGQTLWGIASDHTIGGANVEDTIDRIVSVNHLSGGAIVPGERIKIPE